MYYAPISLYLSSGNENENDTQLFLGWGIGLFYVVARTRTL